MQLTSPAKYLVSDLFDVGAEFVQIESKETPQLQVYVIVWRSERLSCVRETENIDEWRRGTISARTTILRAVKAQALHQL